MGLNKALQSLGLGRPALLILVVVIALLLHVAGDDWRDWLRYDRDALLAGEAWRVLTAHLLHLSQMHLVLNIAGMLIIVWLVGGAFRTAGWSLVLAFSAVSVTAGLLAFSPELQWYVGLSGVLHGILLAGLLAQLAERRTESVVLLCLVCLKLAWEQFMGPLPGSEESTGGPVIVDAHLYGAVGGALAGGILARLRQPAAI